MTAKVLKKIRITAFILCSLVFVAVPLSMAYRYHQIRQQGEAFTFELEGYDPYTPMLGRFVSVRLLPNSYRFADENEAERLVKDSYRQAQPLYLEFAPDNRGIAKISKISSQIPPSRSYWKITNFYRYGTELSIHYPLDRVYVKENRAPELQKQLSDRKLKVTAVIRLQDGIGVLDKIEVQPAK